MTSGSLILGHDQQTPAVEALVAEVDDLRMAAVVFARQRLRRFGKTRQTDSKLNAAQS